MISNCQRRCSARRRSSALSAAGVGDAGGAELLDVQLEPRALVVGGEGLQETGRAAGVRRAGTEVGNQIGQHGIIERIPACESDIAGNKQDHRQHIVPFANEIK